MGPVIDVQHLACCALLASKHHPMAGIIKADDGLAPCGRAPQQPALRKGVTNIAQVGGRAASTRIEKGPTDGGGVDGGASSARYDHEHSQALSLFSSTSECSGGTAYFDDAPRVWRASDAGKRGAGGDAHGAAAWRLPNRSSHTWGASRPVTAPGGHRPRVPSGHTMSTPFLVYRACHEAGTPLHMNCGAGIPQPVHWSACANPVNATCDGRVRLAGRLTDAALHGELRGATVARPPGWLRHRRVAQQDVRRNRVVTLPRYCRPL